MFIIGGCTSQEVADAYGASGQAVCSRFNWRAPGLPVKRPAESVDPVRIMRGARAPGVCGLVEAAAAAGCGVTAVRRVAIELGVLDALLRLYRIRRQRVGRRPV